MQHCDPDVLALVALGEQVPVPDADHLRECARCRADVEELRRVVSAVRVDVTAGAPVPPPPRVWDAIAARTGVRSAPRPEHVVGSTPDAPAARASGAGEKADGGDEADAGDEPDGGDEVAAGDEPDGGDEPDAGDEPEAGDEPGAREQADAGDELARRRDRRPRPRRDARLLIAVAAVALVVGAVGGALGGRLVAPGSPPPSTSGPTAPVGPAGQVMAQVQLANLKPKATSASGSALVLRTPSGARLEVDVSKLTPVKGHFYEVWLIDSKSKKMVSLGILDGTTGEFVIPDGVDVAAYPIVDISVQRPGSPAHSGDSVLRGTIRA